MKKNNKWIKNRWFQRNPSFTQKKNEKFKMPKYSMLFFLQREFYARELARGKNCKHLEAHKYKGPKNLASKGH
jgi:hypothetical protein